MSEIKVADENEISLRLAGSYNLLGSIAERAWRFGLVSQAHHVFKTSALRFFTNRFFFVIPFADGSMMLSKTYYPPAPFVIADYPRWVD